MKALVLKADGTNAILDLPDQGSGIRELQGAVGGYIEAIIGTEGWIMYANEDGLRLNLSVNRAASALVMALCETAGMPLPLGADQLVGDVVIVGNDGTEDNATIPQEWVDEFSAMGLWPE